MNVGDLVRLKYKYPIWLFSFGISEGDIGLITEICSERVAKVYWIKIRRVAEINLELIKPAEQE
tara:strand:+ start:2016 stop:2207 length:192 start_codon:yes stop_codon:yes gene_type:complete